MSQTSKKLVLVSATFMLVTDTSSKEVGRIPCIYYPVRFQKSQEQVRALLNGGSKVNAMSPAYAKKLGFKTQKTNVKAKKIDSFALETFGIVIANFQVEDKSDRPRLFQETFLMANIKFEVVLEMLFLKISNANIVFGERTLT